MKRFSHTWKNRFVQSVRACVYIAVNSFTAGKLFGEIFFKLLVVSCGWKSILDLNSTRWAISHVYKDLQFYKKPKIYFWRRNMQAKTRQLYQNKQLRKLHLHYINFLRFWKDRLCIFCLFERKIKNCWFIRAYIIKSSFKKQSNFHILYIRHRTRWRFVLGFCKSKVIFARRLTFKWAKFRLGKLGNLLNRKYQFL